MILNRPRIFGFSLAGFPLVLTGVMAMTVATSGCSLMFGNIRGIDQKSESYRIADFCKNNPDWIKLDHRKGTKQVATESDISDDDDVSDITYQSKKTSSIISLNSACRAGLNDEKQDLRAFTRELFLGISDNEGERQEEEIEISGIKALQTTIKGELNGQNMMLRAVVLHDGNCLYDLMYIAKPNNFILEERAFSNFVSSLQVK